jgi:hypothetical protein
MRAYAQVIGYIPRFKIVDGEYLYITAKGDEHSKERKGRRRMTYTDRKLL